MEKVIRNLEAFYMVEELIDREHVTGVTDRKIDNLMKKLKNW